VGFFIFYQPLPDDPTTTFSFWPGSIVTSPAMGSEVSEQVGGPLMRAMITKSSDSVEVAIVRATQQQEKRKSRFSPTARWGIHAWLIAVALISILIPHAGFAQGSSPTGTIQGTVEDPSGNAVQGATVVLTNASLALQRETKTEAGGTYIFLLLPPASGYQVSVEQAGFSREVLTDLTVQVTENTVANVRLSVGGVTQEVTVRAAEESVNTTSATLGGVIDARVITAMPLPTRNVLDLMGTDAGVYTSLDSPAGTITQGSNSIFTGGARDFNNNYQLNGTTAGNYELQTLAAGVVPVPNPDAVQEFRTQTSLADATAGSGNGATINLITRAGTSKFHGIGYEFLRNTVLNGNDYFLNQNGSPRPVLQQNQFGGSFGGPIPHLRDTFFFFNYEGLRQSNGVSGTATGSLPVLPATRNAASLASAFGLPASAIDPVAVNLLNAPGPYGGLLVPTGTGARVGELGTYAFSSPSSYNSNQYNARVDHDITNKNHIYSALFFSSGPFTDPTGVGTGSLGQGYSYPLGSQNIAVNDTHIFRANLINDVVFGYNRAQRDIEPTPGYVTIGSIGMTRSNSSVTDLLPQISIANQMSWGGYPNVVHTQRAQSVVFRDVLSWTKGQHNLRFGFDTTSGEYNDGVYVPRGSLSFVTGPSISDQLYGPSPLGTAGDLAFRDFLIGAPTTTTFLSGLSHVYLRTRDYSIFTQDDYRATARLTLNLGIRWDYLGFPTEKYNGFSNFDPNLVPADAAASGGPGLQQGFVLPGKNGVSRTTMLRTNYGNFSPRIGFAYDVFGSGKLAVRGGFGLYYIPPDVGVWEINTGNPPFQISTSTTNTTGTRLLANPFPVLPLPNQFPIFPTFPSLTGLSATGAPKFSGTQLSVGGVDRHAKIPYGENWNFTVQGQLRPNWTLEIAYIGANGVHQPAILQLNNALFFNAANPGRLGITTNSSTNREARVPIAGLGSSGFSDMVMAAQTWYDALGVTLSHPITKNFWLKIAYTYSKSIDNYQANESASYSAGSNEGNPYDLDLNRGVSEYNIPQRLVFTYLWNIPGPKSGLSSYVLSHWVLSGISTYQDGLPGTVTQSIGNSSLTGTTGFGAITPNCKLVASGRVQNHLNNFLNTSCVATQPLLAAGSTFGPTSPYGTSGDQTYTVGTGGGRLLGNPTYGAFYAPFQHRDDVTLSKQFPIRSLGESGNLEFRAEAFKVLNNPIFSAPAFAAGASTFGKITSTIDSTGRQLQFALKLGF
jgi:hypothetical protein